MQVDESESRTGMTSGDGRRPTKVDRIDPIVPIDRLAAFHRRSVGSEGRKYNLLRERTFSDIPAAGRAVSGDGAPECCSPIGKLERRDLTCQCMTRANARRE
uniref:Uncharacterized protein n=1 Tax=Pandoraea faecigallinarum TaxID=656179 RepID=A0A0H3WXC9_9BURK